MYAYKASLDNDECRL